MEIKKYLVVVRLTDGTEDIQQREYNWSSWDSVLEDDRKQFVSIENIIYNKAYIKSIQIIDNPDYNKEEFDVKGEKSDLKGE